MILAPDITELRNRARGDLRMGVPVALLDGNGRSGALVIAAETIAGPRLDELRALSPDLSLTLTDRRAQTLRARVYDGDLARLRIPDAADATWVRAMADPSGDLRHPMKGPFDALRDGSPDLHRAALALTKSARLLPAALVAPLPDALKTARAHALTSIPASSVLPTSQPALSDIVSARLPLDVSEAGRLHVFRPDDGGEEHYAVEIGTPDRSRPVLARLHSACLTGDLLGSLKCDCGPQLHAAMAQMGAEGAGVLLYLNQEGRGIGLANKMRAYSLQDQGFDTVEANHRLGFEDDERDFRIGADILRLLGFASVRLLTNNPAKIDRMTASGLAVTERVPLKVGQNRHNAHYLRTKADKSGHDL